jgi:hypothetical protein
MTSSISDTTHSPAPFSPFTTNSGGSDLATSDGESSISKWVLFFSLITRHVESPDLGAFTIVFRALNDFQQPRNFIPHTVASTTVTATSALSRTESESDPNNRGSTVWNQHPIASYLSISSRTATMRHSAASPPPTEPPSSDTEGEIMIDVDSGEYDDSNDPDEDTLPSLGYLDEALQFIAAERAKLTAPRDNSWHRSQSGTSDDPPRGRQQQHQRRRQQQQQQQQQPRRRRRRAKARSLGRTIGVPDSFGQSGAVDAEIHDGDDASDFISPSPSPDISSSELAVRFKSTPASPPRRKARRRNSVRSASADARPRLGHSLSTPSLRSGPLDPRVVRLRALAIKLKFLFAAEAELLTAILSNQSLQSPSPNFIDPRGPTPEPGQPLVHVFVD